MPFVGNYPSVNWLGGWPVGRSSCRNTTSRFSTKTANCTRTLMRYLVCRLVARKNWMMTSLGLNMRTPPPPEPKQELAGEQTIEWTEVVTNLKNGIEMTDYAMCDGLLYKVLDCQGGPPLRLCVPTRWRTEIIRTCHDDITADHMGQTRTLTRYANAISGLEWMPTSSSTSDVAIPVRRARESTGSHPDSLKSATLSAHLNELEWTSSVLFPSPVLAINTSLSR